MGAAGISGPRQEGARQPWPLRGRHAGGPGLCGEGTLAALKAESSRVLLLSLSLSHTHTHTQSRPRDCMILVCKPLHITTITEGMAAKAHQCWPGTGLGWCRDSEIVVKKITLVTNKQNILKEKNRNSRPFSFCKHILLKQLSQLLCLFSWSLP